MAFVLGFGAAKLPAMRLQTSNFFFRRHGCSPLCFLFTRFVVINLFLRVLEIEMRQVLCIFGSSFVSSFLYGGIVTYLEGRRSTEILLASISASLVFAGTVSRACAAELLHWGVPPRLMPLLLGSVSFLLAAFLLVETARAPPPSRADVAARSARTAMPPSKQWEFVRENLLGVVATIGIWACMAGLRSFRDFYTQQIFAAALKDDSPSSKVYVLADVPGAILSFISLVMMSWVSNNQRALFLMLLTNVSGHSVKGWRFLERTRKPLRLWALNHPAVPRSSNWAKVPVPRSSPSSKRFLGSNMMNYLPIFSCYILRSSPFPFTTFASGATGREGFEPVTS
ncbi:Uncharacterized protein SCF082_LOCUS45476 [Durusdinium trenchii]|uniref:Solute carrier family 40 protein n=1 Tax=Durusdinium trenchii TaxID=1381693 RepID=A0ABP0RCP9_9DINO